MVSTQEPISAAGLTGSVNQMTININREFHTEESSTYWLPKDDDEQKRLVGQHFGLKELCEGNVRSNVTKALDFEKGISILDVGCGSGVWIMDMINDYPNCTYHGCDIVNATSKFLNANQFTFSYGNVVKGLPYADNTFDFVHMRLLILALRKEEWPIAIKEVIRVVKPGGMLQLTEAHLKLPDDTSCAYYKLVSAFKTVAHSKGQDMDIAKELEDMLSVNRNVSVLQSECRWCRSNSGTLAAKKLIWDGIEIAKSTMSSIKPLLGVDSEESALKFLDDLNYCLTHTECYFRARSVTAQKF
ncbi:hypothetical protein G6F60_006258 [Rhizopus arrhizus]|nr:hypothetical protein G6F60_006258 [Rhizopus arrhizus]